MRVLGEELLLRAAQTLRARRLGVDGTASARRTGHPNLGAHINPFYQESRRLCRSDARLKQLKICGAHMARTPAQTAGAIAPAPPARAQPSSRHAYATGIRGIPIPRTSARGTNSVRIGTCDVRDTRVALAGDHGECGCWVRRNALPRVLLRTPRGVAASRLRAHPRVGQIRSE